ncbi:MAG: hypothetical protein VKI83_03585 [Synechococcaceae cyanobacterium]|nr:hypothetical protein [Synechococcaceae cyanobacterium]
MAVGRSGSGPGRHSLLWIRGWARRHLPHPPDHRRLDVERQQRDRLAAGSAQQGQIQLRVLMPGGEVRISVPDLEILAVLFLQKEVFSVADRLMIMRMMYGGQVDADDQHKVGLNEEFPGRFLRDAGFCVVRRVESFGLFEDTSTMLFHGVPISLNMVAVKAV